MRLRYAQSLLNPVDGILRVTAVAFSPETAHDRVPQKLAAATTDRVVTLYDAEGQKRDKFKTKPASKDPASMQPYVVRGMAFSPDGTRLAVAQSDNIVFVYRLGEDWGEKKSICNRFEVSAPVTCVVWLKTHPEDILFGCTDGKVRVGYLRTNKADTAYAHKAGSAVVSLVADRDGVGVVSGHNDGTLMRYAQADGVQADARHTCAPFALAWAEHIVAAGADGHITMYRVPDLSVVKTFDLAKVGAEGLSRDVTCAVASPGGDSVVLGGFDCLRVFAYNRRRGWELFEEKRVENLYTVTSLAWRQDGSRLAVGTLCGCVDLYESCLRRVRYGQQFELHYISKSQVIVQNLETRTRLSIRSAYGYEIDDMGIKKGRFVVGRTSESLLLGDLETKMLSEVAWPAGTGEEKFLTGQDGVCLILCNGEVTVVEYSNNEPIGAVRTDYCKSALVSVRVQPQRGMTPAVKRLAYLVDLQTVRVRDLIQGVDIADVAHGERVDWLELNPRGTHLLFRDKRRQLSLLDVDSGRTRSLLNVCSYVQWVPESDVIVAQSGDSMVVWYSCAAPDRQETYPIKGDITDIERNAENTVVLVKEGPNHVEYTLDNMMIEFDSAVEARDYWRAVDILQRSSEAVNPQVLEQNEGRWNVLAESSLAAGELGVAELAWARLGDLARSRFVQSIRLAREKYEAQTACDGLSHPVVRARLEALRGDFDGAESILLQAGCVDDAVKMYRTVAHNEEALRIAERFGTENVESMRGDVYNWLLESGQEDKAAAMCERDGDHLQAISLYLAGGLPARAARVVMNPRHGGESAFEPALLERVSSALLRAGLFSVAGDFLEWQSRLGEAKAAYLQGYCFEKAVDLCRRHFPSDTMDVEDSWGEWHAQMRQWDAAVNHFIEAGNFDRAIDAALEARQWVKAVQILEQQRPSQEAAAAVYRRIAKAYEQSGNHDEAEQYYVKADAAADAWEMYVRARMWDRAFRVASGYLLESEMRLLYTRKARDFEQQARLQDAERLYVAVSEYDQAISMFKRHGRFDDMIRLVSRHRRDLLSDTHLHLAQQLEEQGRLREAEKHYVEAQDWKSAVHMYRRAEQWDDALRVAKTCAGPNAARQVAYARAVTLGGEAGAQYLTKHGLVEQALDYAMESSNFALAFDLANQSMKARLKEVHLKYAMYLEDEGRFEEAEEEFVKAERPREAIDMHIHAEDFGAALRVAENHDAASIPDVQCAHAKSLAGKGEYARAEALYLSARQPELAAQMYQTRSLWNEALRVAQHYLPEYKTKQIRLAMSAASGGQMPGGGAEGALARAQALERGREWTGAIEAYLALDTSKLGDLDALQDCWERAVALAENHVSDRLQDAVDRASAQLCGIGRHAAAADVCRRVHDWTGAIKAFAQGGMWDEARSLANANGSADLKRLVQQQYERQLVQAGDADGLASQGATTEALDMMVRRGEWEKVHEMAAKLSPDTAAVYVRKHATMLLAQRDPVGAARVLDACGPPVTPDLLPVCVDVARQVVALPRDREDGSNDGHLARVMRRLHAAVQASPSLRGAPGAKDVEALTWTAHLLAMRRRAVQEGWVETAALQSTALCRYVPAIPADKAFFLAGDAWRAAGRENMAFVFLNKLLDIYDAREEQASGGDPALDMSDMVETDLPRVFELPEDSYLDDTEQEDVREWVLAVSVQAQVEQELSQRTCTACGAATFEQGLRCHNCSHVSQQCCVTGGPVQDVVECRADGRHKASRDSWNQWVERFQACPWCGSAQGANY
ncbi:unnamed protein product [Pedinophyceae sp. YPF-701]|nr:unnamed protein product [Pedinophyceae sp. YPF-701]